MMKNLTKYTGHKLLLYVRSRIHEKCWWHWNLTIWLWNKMIDERDIMKVKRKLFVFPSFTTLFNYLNNNFVLLSTKFHNQKMITLTQQPSTTQKQLEELNYYFYYVDENQDDDEISCNRHFIFYFIHFYFIVDGRDHQIVCVIFKPGRIETLWLNL